MRLQLANYEVMLPSGVYDAQFEEAQRQLLNAKREYRETLKYCAQEDATIHELELRLENK